MTEETGRTPQPAAPMGASAVDKDEEDEKVEEQATLVGEAKRTTGTTAPSTIRTAEERAMLTSAIKERVAFMRVLVDVRPFESFVREHIVGSTYVDVLDGDRLMELPSRSVETDIGLLCPDDETRAAAIAWLQRGQYVCRIAVTEAELDWGDLRASGMTEHGSLSFRLWNASPTLETCFAFIDSVAGASARAAGRRPRMLDLGAGAGRDAVFAAQHGWDVVAVDCVPAVLRRLRGFVARQGVESAVEVVQLDLLRPSSSSSGDEEGSDHVKRLLAEGAAAGKPFSLVNMSRFMHRSVLHSLSENLPPGAFVAVHHFLVGATGRTGRGLRDPQALDAGELTAQWFGPAKGFDPPVMNFYHWLPDGRPMVSFVARRTMILGFHGV